MISMLRCNELVVKTGLRLCYAVDFLFQKESGSLIENTVMYWRRHMRAFPGYLVSVWVGGGQYVRQGWLSVCTVMRNYVDAVESDIADTFGRLPASNSSILLT